MRWGLWEVIWINEVTRVVPPCGYQCLYNIEKESQVSTHLPHGTRHAIVHQRLSKCCHQALRVPSYENYELDELLYNVPSLSENADEDNI